MLGVIFFTSMLRSSCEVLGIFKNRQRAHQRDRSCWLTLGCQVGIQHGIWDAACPHATHPLGQWWHRASRLRRSTLVKRYDPASARSHRKPLRVHTVTGLLEPPLGVMRQRNAGTLSVMPAHSSSVTWCINIQEVHTHTWYINVTSCSVKYIYMYTYWLNWPSIMGQTSLQKYIYSHKYLWDIKTAFLGSKRSTVTIINYSAQKQGGWFTTNS